MIKRSIFPVSKVILLMAVLLSFSNTTVAQEAVERNNEIRIDLLNSMFGAWEGQYERLLKNNSSLGVNLGIGNNYEPEFDNIFRVTPTFRQYFGEGKSSGIFIETALRYSYDYNRFKGEKSDKFSSLGLGVGTGFKLVAHDKITASFKAGLGRYLRKTDPGNGFYWTNFEVSLGRRF